MQSKNSLVGNRESFFFRKKGKLFLYQLKMFHNDESGPSEMVEKLIILALIAIPLLIVGIAFGEKIIEVAQEKFESLFK